MKDHGVKPEKLYETMAEEPETIYPYITLPSECFDKEGYEPGHKCTLKIEVEIDTMGKEFYSCKLLKSEEIE